MLGNMVSIVGFVYVLAKFFEARIIGKFCISTLLSCSLGEEKRVES